jgi:hypothetical protein
MTEAAILEISRRDYSDLWDHLLPKGTLMEEAAFAFVEAITELKVTRFKVIEWLAVPTEGFVYQSEIGFELTDEMTASVIKHAHDLNASLVEFHSHSGHWPAKFSPSDRFGFIEFVPHVWWRLKSRPYFSVVVTQTGFDAFAWIRDANMPERLDAIEVDGQLLQPTNLSPLTLDESVYD